MFLTLTPVLTFELLHHVHEGAQAFRVGDRARIFGWTQLAAHEHARVTILHRAFGWGSEQDMHFARAALRDDLLDVPFRDAATRHDDDPISRASHQLCNQIQTFERGGFLPRCEDAVNAQRDQRLEGLKWLARHIKGAVKRHAHRVREFDQGLGSLAIDRSVGFQNSDHDAVRACAFCRFDIALHHPKLDVGVTKIAAARADDDVQINRQKLAREFDGAEAGRGAAFDKVVAQFDAVCAALLRRNGGLDRVNTRFDDEALGKLVWRHGSVDDRSPKVLCGRRLDGRTARTNRVARYRWEGSWSLATFQWMR